MLGSPSKEHQLTESTHNVSLQPPSPSTEEKPNGCLPPLKKAMAVGCLGTVILCIGFVVLIGVALRHGDPVPYYRQLEEGMSYAEIKRIVPERFIDADLHLLHDTPYSIAEARARETGIDPQYLMVLTNLYWPITTATACYLFFDEDKMLVWHFKSAS